MFYSLVINATINLTGFVDRQVFPVGFDNAPNMLCKVWNTLLCGKLKADFSKEVTEAEALSPETENSDSICISSALDTTVAISLLMRAFGDGETKTVVEAVMLIRGSVDRYVQELEDMGLSDPNLESNILNHGLMQKELKRQREDLDFIAILNDDISKSISIVLK